MLMAAGNPPVQKGWLRLGPMNRRRLNNFRRNRRGLWSFWIFLVLFVVSLLAEFVANDRPLIASYKGEILFPVFFNYPEEKFGGFEATTDYRDPVISGEIEAHGWMIWPPIRFANDTTVLSPPLPAPSPPTWMLTQQQCQKALASQAAHDPQSAPKGPGSCRDLEWNWLGTEIRVARRCRRG